MEQTSHHPSLPRLANFDERRWIVLKIRWISLAAAICYPLWAVVCKWLVQGAYDPLFQRLAVSTVALLIFTLTLREDADSPILRPLYHFMCFAMTAHVFFLIHQNDYSTVYIFGGFFLLFCAGPALLSEYALRYYFICSLLIAGILCANKFNQNTVLLLLCTANAAVISYFGLRAMLSLIEQLRLSKAEIENKSRTLDSMLNSLGQGFLSFGRDAVIMDTFSKACKEILETDPGGKSVWDVLRIKESQRESLASIAERAFNNPADFNILESAFPKAFEHSQKRSIQLNYYPSLNSEGKLLQVVIVATDKTDLVHAERAAEAERKNSLMVATIVKNKRLFTVYFNDLKNGVSNFEKVIASGGVGENSAIEFKRYLHSVKGGAGLFFMDEIGTLVHELEGEWKKGEVDLAVATKLIEHQVGVLKSALAKFTTTYRDILSSELRSERAVEVSLSTFGEIALKPYFQGSPEALQNDILSLTLQPIMNYFNVYSALVLKMAKSQSKQILPVEFQGGDFLVFPEPYSSLFSNYVHVFRNVVDHGLETPQERVASGKNLAGRLSVSFARIERNGRSLISIETRDDGRGIDPAKIRKKLEAAGRGEDASRMTEDQLLQVVFEPEFSTRDTVTTLSGRGVGLNALSESVRLLGGSIRVDSKVGEGSTISVVVPEFSPRDFLQRTGETK